METLTRKNIYRSYLSKEGQYIDHNRGMSIYQLMQNSYTSKTEKQEQKNRHPRITEKKPALTLELNGAKYEMAYKLQSIVNQINEAKEILDYEEGWDGECALPTNEHTFENAVLFVIACAKTVFKVYEEVLATPYIDILKDGSVSVHWENRQAQLLIVFKKDNDELAYYYAENKESKVPFKSAVEPRKPVDDLLILWMQKNLV